MRSLAGLSNGARNLLDVSRVGTVWAGLGSRLAAHPEMIGSSCGETIAIKRKYLGIITVQGRGRGLQQRLLWNIPADDAWWQPEAINNQHLPIFSKAIIPSLCTWTTYNHYCVPLAAAERKSAFMVISILQLIKLSPGTSSEGRGSEAALGAAQLSGQAAS